MKLLPLITHWLSWKPGNGYSILIGLDKILGIGNTTIPGAFIGLKNTKYSLFVPSEGSVILGLY
jgi:hypothetical protein